MGRMKLRNRMLEQLRNRKMELHCSHSPLLGDRTIVHLHLEERNKELQTQ